MTTTADLAVGDFRISPSERSLFLQGQPVLLGARAFDLLLVLIEHRDRVVAKNELLALVWPGLVVEDGNLSVQISALRKVLGSKAIATVPGRGYRFTASVEPCAPPVANEAPPAHAPSDPVAAPPPSYESLMRRLRGASIDDASRGAGAADQRGWLPATVTALLGRASALEETQRLMHSTRCLTLTGAGGAGKTRLALALAEAVRTQYPGGTWWIGLDTLADPALLAETLARALGGALLHQPALQALTECLAGRRVLLVLDNCEHLVEGCAELAAGLLRQLPQLHLLVTSRESLRIAGEVAWTVPPLDVPPAAGEPLERLGRHASMQLLLERIRQHTPAFELTPGNAPSLAHICRGLDGLPLALELVAAQVGPRTPAQVAARLDRSLALLNLGPRGGLRHHQTMAAAVDWGYRLLAGIEQAVFSRLSVFTGGWTTEGAAAVCADLGIDVDALPDLLGRLLRASMVLVHPADGAARFRMLEPVRQFALAQLDAQGQVDSTRRLLLAWYQGRCRAVAAQLAGPRQAQGYAFLESEFDNLRALLAWSRQHDVEGGLGLATDLWRFWQVKGHAQEMLDWFDQALPLAQGLPPPQLAAACNAAGVMARTCGRYARAVDLHQQAVALQREVGNRKGEASALNNLCVIARDQHDHAAVERHGRAALQIAREIGDLNLQGLALMHLGCAQRGLERPAEAEAMFRQSFAIFSELGEQRAQGTVLNFLGHLALAEGRAAEAERCFAQALDLNRELEDFWGLGITTGNLASLHHKRGDGAAALDLLLQSLAHYRRAGALHGLEDGFELLARIAQARGALPRAAWCWGVVERLEQDMGKVLSTARKAGRQQDLRRLEAAMPDELFGLARAAGARVTLTDAFAAVLPDGGLH